MAAEARSEDVMSGPVHRGVMILRAVSSRAYEQATGAAALPGLAGNGQNNLKPAPSDVPGLTRPWPWSKPVGLAVLAVDRQAPNQSEHFLESNAWTEHVLEEDGRGDCRFRPAYQHIKGRASTDVGMRQQGDAKSDKYVRNLLPRL